MLIIIRFCFHYILWRHSIACISIDEEEFGSLHPATEYLPNCLDGLAVEVCDCQSSVIEFFLLYENLITARRLEVGV